MVLLINYILSKFILPKSKDDDSSRREFILNILLIASITLVFIAFVIQIIVRGLSLISAESFENSGSSLWITFIIFSLFAFLYVLSRKGFFRLASYLLTTVFFLLASYMAYKWGVEVQVALLCFALVIIISGVLISARFAFIISVASSLILLVINYLQTNKYIIPNLYWEKESAGIIDIVIFTAIFIIIAVVSWLSNREIEKSLTRARKSEAELKKERDSLEITVEARTRELKETQAEKMAHLYRFAEFGRLSSGLFHDLINPLTAVSLNLEKGYVAKAVRVAKKLENVVAAVRKQLSRQENKTLFSINEEIAQALEVLAHKALKSGVTMRFFSHQEVKTYGDAIKFNQVALNLVDNAIDSQTQTVILSLSKESNTIIFEVKDKGAGISEENKQKLFEPFFTTKDGQGIGIGLSMIKRIIEKDFDGSIEVASKEGEGSVFTVKFYQNNG